MLHTAKAALPFVVLAAAVLAPPAARAADPVTLTLRDHRFTPSEITVPAGQRVQIVVVNADATPEEFESGDLRVEKVVAGGGRITVTVGPLKPGSYRFVGEYHEDTAKGTLTAVAGGAAKE